jgi:hypothetical protein
VKQIGVKSKIWDYEKEYRLSKIGAARTIAVLRKETICELIFGCKMTYTTKMNIVEFCAKEYPHIRIFESQLSKTRFETDLIQLF